MRFIALDVPVEFVLIYRPHPVHVCQYCTYYSRREALEDPNHDRNERGYICVSLLDLLNVDNKLCVLIHRICQAVSLLAIRVQVGKKK
jgi:hypothetical protein